MHVEWDDAKSAANLAKHGVAFDDALDFDLSIARVLADTRRPYGEVRLTAIAPIGERVHVMVFTIRRTRLRLISLRRASTKEVLRYAAEFQDADAGGG